MVTACSENRRPNGKSFQPSSAPKFKIHFRPRSLTHRMWSQDSTGAEHDEKHVVDSVACKVELLYSHESGSILRRCLTPKTSVRMAWDHNNLLTLITETHDVSTLHPIVLYHPNYTQGTEYLSPRGKLEIIGEFVKDGKATIKITGQHIVVMISQAEPAALGTFIRAFVEKV